MYITNAWLIVLKNPLGQCPGSTIASVIYVNAKDTYVFFSITNINIDRNGSSFISAKKC